MRSLFIASSVVALLAAGPAFAQTSPSPSAGMKPATETQGAGTTADNGTQRSDTRFIDRVARSGEAEVDLGKMAEQKASNPQVKQLAERLVSDHTKANQQLMQLAQQQGVKPPASPSHREDAEKTRLEKLNGDAFDRAFVRHIVNDHQKNIEYFQREANSLQDPQLKSFAQQTLPVLQQHLQMAQQVETQLSSAGSSTQTPGSSSSPSGQTNR